LEKKTLRVIPEKNTEMNNSV